MLDCYELMTRGRSPETIQAMRKIERGVGKCWEKRVGDPSHIEQLQHARKLNDGTFFLMHDIITLGPNATVEILQHDEDVELAHAAWLVFVKLAATIKQATRE